jgi:hypothetical protein
MSVRANFGRNFFSRNVFFEKNLWTMRIAETIW